MRLDVCIFSGDAIAPASLVLVCHLGPLRSWEPDVAVSHAAKPRERCPLYCTINHKRGNAQHAHLIAEVGVTNDNALVGVNLVRPDKADEIELAIGKGWHEPAVANLTAEEARALRDALNVAVAVLDRT
jgi:hypothetical protein